MDVQSLIKKLGHDLTEIRVRALENISSKLDHHVLTLEDLVQEKLLFINLLQWFNFPQCPKQNMVLQLLADLSKHTSAGRIITQIAGVEFLTQLRPNVEKELHDTIDDILDNLFHLPDVDDFAAQHECVYQQDMVYETATDVTQLSSREFQSTGLSSSGTMGASQSTPTLTPEILHSFSNTQTASIDGNSLQSSSTSALCSSTSNTLNTMHLPGNTNQTGNHSIGSLAGDVRFSSFPWIGLTSVDRHVLSNTERSFTSSDVNALVEACHFFSDVMIHDFPAQVFLQRPAILKSLLSLIQAESALLQCKVIVTLFDFIGAVEERMKYTQHPDFFTTKQRFPNSDDFNTSAISSISSAQISADSIQLEVNQRLQQSDTLKELATEEASFEDIHGLQMSQWTVPQFALATVEHVLPLTRNSDGSLQHLRLLHAAQKLLLSTLSVEHLWNEQSPLYRDMSERLQVTFEQFADLIHNHHHTNLEANISAEVIVSHRLLYTGLASIFSLLISNAVPLSKAAHVVPEGVVGIISLIVEDESLTFSDNGPRQLLMPYQKLLDPNEYKAFQHACDISLAMEDAVNFLLNFNEKKKCFDECMIESLQSAIKSLCYHENLDLVKKSVYFMSQLHCMTKPVETLKKKSQECLLQLIAHPKDDVRYTAYKAMETLVKVGLNVNQVVDPSTVVSTKVNFLIDRCILEEICNFGMNDSFRDIKDLSEKILTHLLNGELLLPRHMWEQLMDIFPFIIIPLQGHIQKTSQLGKAFLALIEDSSFLPEPERLKASLRLFYMSDDSLRVEAVARLSKHLDGDFIPRADLLKMAGLFRVDPPHILQESYKSIFKDESLLKVLRIFMADDVDMTVMVSAIEQLAIMLQDDSLQHLFLENDGLHKITDIITATVSNIGKPNKNNKLLCASAVKILLHLVQHNADIRQKLGQDKDRIITLVKCAVLLNGDESIQVNISILMMFLLFGDITSMKQSSGYHLPVRCKNQAASSPHRIQGPSELDPLLDGPLKEFLMVRWNMEYHGSIGALVEACKMQEKSVTNLSSVQQQILQVSNTLSALQQHLFSMENATNHAAVTKALVQLKMYMALVSVANDKSIINKIASLKWKAAVERFLQVIPKSDHDELLLESILDFLGQLLNLDNPDILKEISELLLKKQDTIIKLTDRINQDKPSFFLRLRKKMLKFMTQYIRTVNRFDEALEILNIGDILSNVAKCLEEDKHNALTTTMSALICITHMTARKDLMEESSERWKTTICQHTVLLLQKLLVTYHDGRNRSSMSFLGRGVTFYSALSIQHILLSFNMKKLGNTWEKILCSQSLLVPENEVANGLLWLTSLWTYRDVQVRSLGLSIAVSLSSTEEGSVFVATHTQHIVGGIWAAIFSIMLDSSEASLVRQKATMLLQNLLSRSLPSNGKDGFIGPMVINQDTQDTMSGLPALDALLSHTQFFEVVADLLTVYFPQPSLRVVALASDPGNSTYSYGTLTTGLSSIVAGQGKESESHTLETNKIKVSTPMTPDKYGSRISRDLSWLEMSNVKGEYPSITSPCLVQSLADLLCNLLKMNSETVLQNLHRYKILPTLVSYLDPPLLTAYSKESEHNEMVLHHLLRMHISILQLLHQCVILRDKPVIKLLQEKDTLAQVLHLLEISHQDDKLLQKDSVELWQTSLDLVAILHKADDNPDVFVVFQELWLIITDRSLSILQSKTMHQQPIWFSVLHFLAVVLNGEELMDTLDQMSNDGNICSGSLLCKELIRITDATLQSNDTTLKLATLNALKSLFVASHSSKITALHDGLMETLCDHVSDLHYKLTNDAINTSTKQNKDNPILSELVLLFDVIRNFMSKCSEAKIAAKDCGLGQHAHNIWCWAQTDSLLMTTLLLTLSVFCSHNIPGSTSLVYTSHQHSGDMLLLNNQLSSNSLVHHLIRLIQKEFLRQSSKTKLKEAFTLLTITALCPEVRGILSKANFMSDFSKLTPQRSKKSSRDKQLETLWLDLLLNLSFSKDGQNAILKISDGIGVLLDLGLLHCRKVLLILTNLSSIPANKQKLLSNENVLPFMLNHIGCHDEETNYLATQCVYTLLYNSQKTKAAMRSIKTIGTLKETYSSLLTKADRSQFERKAALNLHYILMSLK